MICEQLFRLKKNGEPYKGCYCRHPELIENYDKAIADKTQTWDCHHRLETHNSDGEKRLIELSARELIALGTYYDRPADELMFLTHGEHKALHNKGNKIWLGKKHSEETKAKIRAANKGKKRGPISEEQKAKISASMKGKNRRPSPRKGKHWKLIDGHRVWY